ncbi:hypothetical protein [Streptomyces sp. NBC_00063]|uniref:hypothetical protein n=1 Tax=Streptomyces sp. NBC_00063 TaxID=2975638 RepID=UPI003D7512D5
MCEHSDDLNRTLLLLGELLRYAHGPGADPAFLKVVGTSLAASMPAGWFPPGFDPTDGPQYPGEW